MCIRDRKIQKQLANRQQRLEVRAQASGRLVPLPIEDSARQDELELSRNTASLAAENTGCFVERSEPLAAVFENEALQVRLQVAETQINRIAEGDRVQLIICQVSPEYISGNVSSIDIEKSNPSDGQPDSDAEKDTIGVVVSLDHVHANVLLRSDVKACVYGKKLPIYRYLWQEFYASLDL